MTEHDSSFTEPNLPEIPDTFDVQREPWETGEKTWYAATIIPSYTSFKGSIFDTEDVPPAPGKGGRNIKLRMVLKRKDGETANMGALVNYDPQFLTREWIEAAKGDAPKGSDAARAKMTLTKLARLKHIAGVQLGRNGHGGLDLSPLFNKTVFVRPTRGQKGYLEVADFLQDVRTEAPKSATIA